MLRKEKENNEQTSEQRIEFIQYQYLRMKTLYLINDVHIKMRYWQNQMTDSRANIFSYCDPGN